MSQPSPRSLHRGTVKAFDDPAGLGVISDEAGSEWPFHCTAIVDGGRFIEAGTAVTFRLSLRHLGVTEAAEVAPI